MARRKSIALLVDHLGGDYQTGLYRAVEDAAGDSDVNLLVTVGRSLGAPNPIDAAQNEIYARLGPACVDGIVVGSGCIGGYVSPRTLAEFCADASPLPLCSVSANVAGVPSLAVSNRRGMRIVVEHLIVSHGCRRIAYIRGPHGGDEAQERFEGYRSALEEHGIEYVPRLVETGDFWIRSGAEAARHLLDSGRTFDALVAANDYMALGAIDVLRARGKRVPQDLLVAGFDDAPSARIASPSLTTVRQPLSRLGRLAVETIVRQWRSEAVQERVELDVELVTRQSCGCAYRALQSSLAPRAAVLGISQGPPRTVLEAFESRIDDLRQAMLRGLSAAPDAMAGWADRLLSALRAEFSGASGSFLLELEDVLDSAQPRADSIHHFNSVISAMRGHFRRSVTDTEQVCILDDLWHAAILLVGAALDRSHMRAAYESEHTQDVLRESVERLSTVLSHSAMMEALRSILPAVGIRSASVSVYEGESHRELRPLFVMADHLTADTEGQRFSSAKLAPEGFFPTDRRWAHIVMPLSFGSDHFGVAVFEGGAHASTYRELREEIGTALKLCGGISKPGER
jgi:DNA-binding LacI/PurR family transcriptional regulator